MKKIRTFVAINLPNPLVSELQNLIIELRTEGSGITWVKPENIHITLKFLGDTSTDLLPQIEQRISRICREIPPFELSSKQGGVFPRWEMPKVLWVGVDAAPESMFQLAKLKNALEGELEPLGFTAETRPFKPHLTIGRVKNNRTAQTVVEHFRRIRMPEYNIPVEQIELMRSQLTPAGSIYTVLKSFPLKKT